MNVVTLSGRITKDLELRYTQNNIAGVSFFIALNNGKDNEGNNRPADFPKVCVYDKQAENLAKYCKKGSLIGIEGRIKTRTWDKEDGTKEYETYVMAHRIEFLDTKPSNNGNILPEPDYIPKTAQEEQKMQETDPYKQFGEEITLDENSLPF